MDLDALLTHYFGTLDPDALEDDALAEGTARAAIDFGTARDAGRRFALWVLLHALGDAPDPDKAFDDPRLRQAARDYARAADRLDEA